MASLILKRESILLNRQCWQERVTAGRGCLETTGLSAESSHRSTAGQAASPPQGQSPWSLTQNKLLGLERACCFRGRSRGKEQEWPRSQPLSLSASASPSPSGPLHEQGQFGDPLCQAGPHLHGPGLSSWSTQLECV